MSIQTDSVLNSTLIFERTSRSEGKLVCEALEKGSAGITYFYPWPLNGTANRQVPLYPRITSYSTSYHLAPGANSHAGLWESSKSLMFSPTSRFDEADYLEEVHNEAQLLYINRADGTIPRQGDKFHIDGEWTFVDNEDRVSRKTGPLQIHVCVDYDTEPVANSVSS